MTTTAPPSVRSGPGFGHVSAQSQGQNESPRRVVGAVVVALVVATGLAAVHLTQGTSDVGIRDLLGLFLHRDQPAWDVLVGSRLPRLVAGILVGVALGGSGTALQSVARNNLAAPDILGVSAGAYLAVTAVAAFGISMPVISAGAVALVGALLAAGLVMTLSAAGTTGPTRLVLAGSATALALTSLTTLLLILFEEETQGLYAWGSGSLQQANLTSSQQMAPIVVLALAGLVLLGQRLDILALGDDTASVLGVPVASTRLTTTLLAVLLAAAAVTLAGPIGFVGLSAPAIVRLGTSRIPGLHRHRSVMTLSAIVGIIVVLGSDVVLRAVVGSGQGVEIPTGVVTSLCGAAILVVLAHQYRDSGPARQAPAAHSHASHSPARFRLVLGLASAGIVVAVIAGLLLGDTDLLLGDVANWLQGSAGMKVTYVLDERVPRVSAALLAGAALAIAGLTIQSVCRNPLAEPGILGITAGAGLAAVSATTFAPDVGTWGMTGAATLGAIAAFAVVYGLSWRGSLSSDRLVLVGVGVWYGLSALIVLVIVKTDPWNTPKALTWLSGSTYGRQFPQLLPVVVALAVITPAVALLHRTVDLLALDDDTPRVLGVRLERTRLAMLAGAVALTVSAVSAVGVVGFVGLVAPHASRSLVGGQTRRALPVAAVLGALLVSMSDTAGRTVIAPAQIPVGLLTALVGTPYFLWLLWRSRQR